jgi:hypothetical protein
MFWPTKMQFLRSHRWGRWFEFNIAHHKVLKSLT